MAVLGLLLLILLVPVPAHAARTVAVDALIVLHLELEQVTALELPEPVSTATTGLPKERLQIGEDGPYLWFIPLDATIPPGRVMVVGASGKLYMVHYKMSPKSDDLVRLTAKPAPTPATPLTDASLLRVLRQGTKLPSAPLADPPVPNPQDPRITLQQPRAFAIGERQGLIVTVTNTQDLPLMLDIRVGEAAASQGQTVALDQWAWPPKRTLKAVSVERDVLPPQGSTQLYVIYEERR